MCYPILVSEYCASVLSRSLPVRDLPECFRGRRERALARIVRFAERAITVCGKKSRRALMAVHMMCMPDTRTKRQCLTLQRCEYQAQRKRDR